MLFKTEKTEALVNFLKEDLIQNLNLLGVLDNVKDAEVYVDDAISPRSVFIRRGYFNHIYTKDDKFLEEVLKEHFSGDGFYGFSGMERGIAEKIKAKHELDWENRCALYYMPKENLDLSKIKNPVSSIKLEDAPIVDKFYEYRNDYSLATIKNDISERPSSAVYIEDEIACWVLIHDDDSMGIMYTREEYRKKGLAIDVSLDLAKKIFDKGKIPFLQIVERNQMSPGLAKKCGFVEYGYADWFGIIVGMPKEFVDLFDKAENKFAACFKEIDTQLSEMNLKSSIKLKAIEEDALRTTLLTSKVKGFLEIPEGYSIKKVETDKELECWGEIIIKGYKLDNYGYKFMKALKSDGEKPLLYLGYYGDTPVSAVACQKVEEDVYSIEYLYVTAEYRNKGYGKVLLQEALRSASEQIGLVIAECNKRYKNFFEKINFKTNY